MQQSGDCPASSRSSTFARPCLSLPALPVERTFASRLCCVELEGYSGSLQQALQQQVATARLGIMSEWLAWVGFGASAGGDTTLRDLICAMLVLVATCETIKVMQRQGYFSVMFGPPPAPPVYFRRTNTGGGEKDPPEALHEYDGVHRKQIYLAVKGRVFDVCSGADFYGPEGGGYSALAGQDASRALGIMSMQGKEFWIEDCKIRKVCACVAGRDTRPIIVAVAASQQPQ